MNVAILIISSASLVCSASALLIMAKTAKELQAAKVEVDVEVANLKTKVSRNAQVVKTALGQLGALMPQNPVLVVDFPVHDTHCLEYAPCLFLECNKCGATSKDPKELARGCDEGLIKP